MKVKKYMY